MIEKLAKQTSPSQYAWISIHYTQCTLTAAPLIELVVVPSVSLTFEFGSNKLKSERILVAPFHATFR